MTVADDPVVAAPETAPAAPPAVATAAAIVTDSGTAAPAQATPEATPAAPDAAAPDTATSLLGEAAKPKDEAAPAEQAPAASTEGEAKDEKAPDASASAEEAPPIVYEPWTLPEGMTLDDAAVKPFNDLLVEAKVSQEVGQRLVDMHLAEVARLHEIVTEQNRQSWTEARTKWIDAVKADPEIGGARFETAMHLCGDIIEQFGGTREQQDELRQVLAMTGAGDHPAMIRLIHNVGKVLRPPQPVMANRPPLALSRAQKRYAASLNGASAQ